MQIINPARLAAIAVAATVAWAIPARAANIITFGANANTCGGAVMCSTNGTTGYLINGTGQAFNLSSIAGWFQIDADGTNHLPATQTMAEPDLGAGGYRVVNDTGTTVTSFSITLFDTFDAATPSVVACTGAQAGKLCDKLHGARPERVQHRTERGGLG
jgi:hypothetical protein